jgi:hypothetical protein
MLGPWFVGASILSQLPFCMGWFRFFNRSYHQPLMPASKSYVKAAGNIANFSSFKEGKNSHLIYSPDIFQYQ